MTRTVAIGKPTRGNAGAVHTGAEGPHRDCHGAFPKGTRGIELDAFARRALWEAGLDFDHGTGHGVGSYLSVHEGPQSISKRGMAVLEPGMIISNEPGYYKRGAYGIRIENLVLVRNCEKVAGGEREMMEFETLTLVPIDRASGGRRDAVGQRTGLAQRLPCARARDHRAGTRAGGSGVAGEGDGDDPDAGCHPRDRAADIRTSGVGLEAAGRALGQMSEHDDNLIRSSIPFAGKPARRRGRR